MKISIGKTGNKAKFKAVEISNYKELEKYILTVPYSFGIYKDDYRNKENFLQTELIGLDFDEGVTLEEAEELLKDYTFVIAPTKSHQKEKNGKVFDRFRVILFLSEPITDNEVYEATWFSLYEKFPKIDKACKDSCRYFDPSTSVYKFNSKGLRVDPVQPKPKEKTEAVEISPDQKGKLGKRTLEFLALGAAPGQRHNELFAAARDAHQNLYSKDWFLKQIESLCEKTGDYAFQDAGALKTIDDAFNKDPKHEPRITPRAFKLQRIGELYEDKTEVEWLVDGLLSGGGLSVLSGDPKTGKSTLVRQLITSILRGNKFLGRQCKQGPVHYYAMEEHKQVINSSFKRLGVRPDDNLFVHVGDVLTENSFNDFRDIILETRPALAAVDTLFDFLNVSSVDNYYEVKRELKKLRQVARDSGTHIICVHHNSKGSKDDKRRGNRAILGSNAIAGGMDTIMIVECEGEERIITTSGREVSRFVRRTLVFDKNKKEYSLGPEEPEDF